MQNFYTIRNHNLKYVLKYFFLIDFKIKHVFAILICFFDNSSIDFGLKSSFKSIKKFISGETPLPSGMPAHSELNLKNVQIPKELIPNTENLGKLKRWGLKHYRVNRQRIQELMGTATITTEPELEPRVEKLQEQLTRYKELHQV